MTQTILRQEFENRLLKLIPHSYTRRNLQAVFDWFESQTYNEIPMLCYRLTHIIRDVYSINATEEQLMSCPWYEVGAGRFDRPTLSDYVTYSIQGGLGSKYLEEDLRVRVGHLREACLRFLWIAEHKMEYLEEEPTAYLKPARQSDTEYILREFERSLDFYVRSQTIVRLAVARDMPRKALSGSINRRVRRMFPTDYKGKSVTPRIDSLQVEDISSTYVTVTFRGSVSPPVLKKVETQPLTEARRFHGKAKVKISYPMGTNVKLMDINFTQLTR